MLVLSPSGQDGIKGTNLHSFWNKNQKLCNMVFRHWISGSPEQWSVKKGAQVVEVPYCLKRVFRLPYREGETKSPTLKSLGWGDRIEPESQETRVRRAECPRGESCSEGNLWKAADTTPSRVLCWVLISKCMWRAQGKNYRAEGTMLAPHIELGIVYVSNRQSWQI